MTSNRFALFFLLTALSASVAPASQIVLPPGTINLLTCGVPNTNAFATEIKKLPNGDLVAIFDELHMVRYSNSGFTGSVSSRVFAKAVVRLNTGSEEVVRYESPNGAFDYSLILNLRTRMGELTATTDGGVMLPAHVVDCNY